jgi:pimeloyl-ACP methyl ester carboxylesterase
MKKNFRFIAVTLFTWTLLFLSSCSDDSNSPKEIVLLEANQFLSRSATELQTYLSFSGLDIDPATLKYDVDLYKVKYKTVYKDSEITASGIVILPKTTDAVGMVSFQHGTIIDHRDAPSIQPASSTDYILYATLGSAGFIGVIPDYIGFGESDNFFHPYYIEEPTASSIIDNLKAAKECAAKNGVKFNSKLFLAGYSEGGYATMAAHKAIETQGLNGFNLVASFPAAGGYDIEHMQEYFFGLETYDQPHYPAYVALAYQDYYNWTGTLDDFFQQPYVTTIPSLFDGTKGASEINAQLTETIADLINPDLLAHIHTDPKYNYITTAFKDNSLTDWSPRERMFMYHGDADTTVPYANSVSTYTKLIANGASTSIVSLTTFPGADHASGIVPYLEHLVEEIQKLK